MEAVRSFSIASIIRHPIVETFNLFFGLFQALIEWVFAPKSPRITSFRYAPAGKRIAVIGAGITGVSSAAHCAANGFDVTIIEARSKENGLGGIWSVHSLLYRFHPAVRFDSRYPGQREIRREIINLWRRYNLQQRTFFDTPVTSIRKNQNGKWVINDDEDPYGHFDGIIAAVGVSGNPKMPQVKGHEKFKGLICHSSDLTAKQAKDKKVVIVGGGSSAIEVMQLAVDSGASRIDVLSRKDKWIIPRNIIVQALLASNVWGEDVSLAWIPEWLLRKFFYRDLDDITPTEGLYTASPLVNSDLFSLIRQGSAAWHRGDVLSIEENGVHFKSRAKEVPKGGPGRESFIPADVIVMATGWTRPSLGFLPSGCFQDSYKPPNWYLQVFPPNYPDICAINSTYINAIATAGHLHIGILTRFLLIYLMDPLTRPTEGRMRAWINFTRFGKRYSPIPAFEFLTYAELIYWCIFVLVINPFRWKWAFFVLTGLGGRFPEQILEKEDHLHKLTSEQGEKHASPPS